MLPVSLNVQAASGPYESTSLFYFTIQFTYIHITCAHLFDAFFQIEIDN